MTRFSLFVQVGCEADLMGGGGTPPPSATILPDPGGWALNQTVGQIDVPLWLAILQWAFFFGPGGWACIRRWAVGGVALDGGLLVLWQSNNRPNDHFIIQPFPPSFFKMFF